MNCVICGAPLVMDVGEGDDIHEVPAPGTVCYLCDEETDRMFEDDSVENLIERELSYVK